MIALKCNSRQTSKCTNDIQYINIYQQKLYYQNDLIFDLYISASLHFVTSNPDAVLLFPRLKQNFTLRGHSALYSLLTSSFVFFLFFWGGGEHIVTKYQLPPSKNKIPNEEGGGVVCLGSDRLGDSTGNARPLCLQHSETRHSSQKPATPFTKCSMVHACTVGSLL